MQVDMAEIEHKNNKLDVQWRNYQVGPRGRRLGRSPAQRSVPGWSVGVAALVASRGPFRGTGCFILQFGSDQCFSKWG